MEKIGLKLPFDTGEHKIIITQGNHGLFSHFDHGTTDLSYAVDFGLPIGSGVKAARPGKVIVVFDRSKVWYGGHELQRGNNLGLFSTNRIEIESNDGSRDCYAHLQRGSAMVKRGELVREGQILAETGFNGWVPEDCPHLHFHVQYLREGKYLTLPLEFEEFDGSLDEGDLRAKN